MLDIATAYPYRLCHYNINKIILGPCPISHFPNMRYVIGSCQFQHVPNSHKTSCSDHAPLFRPGPCQKENFTKKYNKYV